MTEFHSDNSYIAVFDILGYRQVAKQNTHQDLLRLHESIIPTSFTHNLQSQRVILVDGHYKTIGGISKTEVQSIMISDTIVLWTPDTSSKSFIDIIYKSMDIIVESIFVCLPVRGAISNGPFSCWTTIFEDSGLTEISLCGTAMVDAYEKQELADWIGCTFSNKCIEYAKALENESHSEIEQTVELIRDKIIMLYEVPLREGEVKKDSVLNWTCHPKWQQYITAKEQRLSIRELIANTFSGLNKASNDWSVRRKIRNTLDFIQSVSTVNLDRKNWPHGKGLTR